MKKVKIKESEVRQLIRESLKEISWQKAQDADNQASQTYWGVIEARLDMALNAIDNELYDDSYNIKKTPYANTLLQWHNTIEKMQKFAERKDKQRDNIEDIAKNKFKSTHNGMNYDDYGCDIQDRRFDAYINDGVDDDEFENNLSDTDKEYLEYDRNR